MITSDPMIKCPKILTFPFAFVATILVVVVCWVPIISIAQVPAREEINKLNNKHDVLENRESATEYLLDRTELHIDKMESYEDKRFAALEARIAISERAQNRAEQMEAIARSLATFLQIAGTVFGSTLIAGVVWAGKRASTINRKVEELGRDHKTLRRALIKLLQKNDITDLDEEELEEESNIIG